MLKPVRYLVGYGPEMLLYALPLRWDPESHDAVNASAHSYPLQLLVELGLLGLVAYVGLTAALLLGGGLSLIRRRTALQIQDRLLYAALVGRVAEQMLGVARVSDTTLFWVLAAALTAMLLISSRDTESPSAQVRPAPSGAGRLRWQ